MPLYTIMTILTVVTWVLVGAALTYWACGTETRLEARWRVFRRLHYPNLTNDQALRIHRGPW